MTLALFIHTLPSISLHKHDIDTVPCRERLRLAPLRMRTQETVRILPIKSSTMSRKYDSTKIQIQARVMSAEVNQDGRKEAQRADVLEKGLIQCLQRCAPAPETLNQATQYARSVRREKGFEKLRDAITFINQNAAGIAETKGKPMPEYEECFRLLCAAGEVLQSEKFKKFKATVVKDLYGPQVAADYGDVTKMPDSLRVAFQEEITETKAKEVIREVIANKMGGDMTNYGKIFGEAPTAVEKIRAQMKAAREEQLQMAQKMQAAVRQAEQMQRQKEEPTKVHPPPPAAGNAKPTKLAYFANPATYVVMDMPVIPRERWQLVLTEVVKAVTK